MGNNNKTAGRMPERSEQVSGNEATGLTPISAEKVIEMPPEKKSSTATGASAAGEAKDK